MAKITHTHEVYEAIIMQAAEITNLTVSDIKITTVKNGLTATAKLNNIIRGLPMASHGTLREVIAYHIIIYFNSIAKK